MSDDDKSPIGDAFAVVPDPRTRGRDNWIQVGAVWESEKGLMIRMQSEPMAWKGLEDRALFIRFREGKDPRLTGGKARDSGNQGQGGYGNQGHGGYGGPGGHGG